MQTLEKITPLSELFQSILVPIDFSPCSMNALNSAASIAQSAQTSLHILYAIEPVSSFAMIHGVEQSAYIEVVREVRQKALQRLEELVTTLKNKGLENVSFFVVEEKASDAILTMIQQQKPSLVCMGTHGYSGLQRFILGSTTEKVIREARCPVLVYHSDDQE